MGSHQEKINITSLIRSAEKFKREGKYSEAAKQYLLIQEQAFQTANQQWKIIALHGLGTIHTCLGNYKIAIEYHSQQLNISRSIDTSLETAVALTSLGYNYYFIENFKDASSYQDSSRNIVRRIDSKEASKIEAKALNYLGLIHSKLTKYEVADFLYDQSINIMKKLISDVEFKKNKLNISKVESEKTKLTFNENNIDFCSWVESDANKLDFKKNDIDIEFNNDIVELLYDFYAISINLTINKREFNQDNILLLEQEIAIKLQELSLSFNRLGAFVQESNAIYQLAKTHKIIGDVDTAKKYCMQSLSIVNELNIPLKNECNKLIKKLDAQYQTYEDFPESQEIEENSCESIKKEIDVVLLTATDIELLKVLQLLKPYPRKQNIQRVYSESATYHLGKFGAYKTVVTRCRIGSINNNEATLAVEQVLRKWNPKAIIMVGIACGRDPTKQKIGDVLIASEIQPYESQRVGKETINRNIPKSSNKTLLDRFDCVHDWKSKSIDGMFCNPPEVGSILSGEKLIDNPEFKAELFEQFPEAIGGEMEGAALCAASERVGTAWILVKSISDWGDGKKHNKHQPLAAGAAASFVHYVLSQKTILNGIQKPRGE